MAFSGFPDLQPEFADALQRMIAARQGISVNSGYRSPEQQAVLYQKAIEKYGSPEKARHWVAPPGNSMHNKRTAADLGFASDADRQWAHDNAADYGLRFRMGHEPWHVEPIGGGGGGGGAAVAAAAPQAGPPGQFSLPAAETASASSEPSYQPSPVPEQPEYKIEQPAPVQLAQREATSIVDPQKQQAQKQQLAQILAMLGKGGMAA
jgi:LAS superfamily LD-carboxypeptidase LdcB